MLTEITPVELAAALDAAVAEILQATGVIQPPVDALYVARELSLTVAWDARQVGRARIVHLADTTAGPFAASILLKPDPRAERRQWALAHEIGEATAERIFRFLDVDPKEAAAASRETIANQIAGRLLLPSDWFADQGVGCDWDLFALKRTFTTASHELIARRMLDFDRPIIVTIFDQGERTWRRSNVAGRTPPLNGREQVCWRAAQRTSQPVSDENSLQRIRTWPIHETDWQREIVLTEILDEF